MQNISMFFVQEFVLGFGVIGGLGLRTGMDPQGAILNAFSKAVDPSFGWIFFVIALIGTLASIYGTLQVGGKLGLIAVGVAFFGGFLMSPIIVFVALLLGSVAPFTVDNSRILY